MGRYLYFSLGLYVNLHPCNQQMYYLDNTLLQWSSGLSLRSLNSRGISPADEEVESEIKRNLPGS